MTIDAEVLDLVSLAVQRDVDVVNVASVRGHFLCESLVGEVEHDLGQGGAGRREQHDDAEEGLSF